MREAGQWAVSDQLPPRPKETDRKSYVIPNLLYEAQTSLDAFPVYSLADIHEFAVLYFNAATKQDKLYAALAPVVSRFKSLSGLEKEEFRGRLTDYVRLYAFLAQVLTFVDSDLAISEVGIKNLGSVPSTTPYFAAFFLGVFDFIFMFARLKSTAERTRFFSSRSLILSSLK